MQNFTSDKLHVEFLVVMNCNMVLNSRARSRYEFIDNTQLTLKNRNNLILRLESMQFEFLWRRENVSELKRWWQEGGSGGSPILVHCSICSNARKKSLHEWKKVIAVQPGHCALNLKCTIIIVITALRAAHHRPQTFMHAIFR